MKKTRGRGDTETRGRVRYGEGSRCHIDKARRKRRAKTQVFYPRHPRVPLLRVSVSALPVPFLRIFFFILHPSSFILARHTVFAVKILSVFLTSARGRPL